MSFKDLGKNCNTKLTKEDEKLQNHSEQDNDNINGLTQTDSDVIKVELSGESTLNSVSSEDSSEPDSENEMSHGKLMQRRRKIEQKKRDLINKLKLHETTARLRASLKTPKSSPTSKQKWTKKEFGGPSRKSLRLQKLEADISGASKVEAASTSEEFINQPRLAPNSISIEAWQCSQDGKEEVVSAERNDIDEDTFKKNRLKLESTFKPSNIKVASTPTASLQKFLADIKSSRCKFRKVVNKRIYSMAVHDRTDAIVVAAASTSGLIGIWNVEESTGPPEAGSVSNFLTYGRNISHLAFRTAKPNLLYFSSHAGVVRALDLWNFTFTECMIDDDQFSVSSFDFQDNSSNVVIAGSSSGDVIVGDSRASSKATVHGAHDRIVKSISVHPVQRHYFASTGNDSKVKIFDFRQLNKRLKPVCVLHEHSKSVDSAFFSPLTGDMLLTTSLDNKIRIFNSKNPSEIQLANSLPHNNHTGRWLSNFKATWHPSREDVAVVGSMNRPRQIDILDSNLTVLHEWVDEEQLQSVCSRTAFHPSRHVMVGGNSSGKVYVFGS